MRRILAILTGMMTLGANMVMAVPVEPGISLALAERRAASLSSLQYDLALQIPEKKAVPITGQLEIRFDYRPSGEPLQLDFRPGAGHLKSLRINGEPTDINFAREHILLPESTLRPGANQVTINFQAGDSALNRSEDYLYTLFVPDRARTAFPLFDQPDLKARFKLSLELPTGWTALTNGPLIASNQSKGRTTRHFAPSEPISSYLFSFVAGRFETISRTVDGRRLTLLHRETDEDKIARNLDTVFELHASSLRWMEEYTGIPLPFDKLDFALIPAFPYGGMEHVGAIQYRASKLLLEADPTQQQLLSRVNLIAHEVAHMWFGNLVTMRWFNDVWTKEVFANFMAAKMANPAFPDIDHDLNFLVQHYPGAYHVDRTVGANPIRQSLDNLNQAGQMYGAIIYKKAPIMMRQLELVLGEKNFRKGMHNYLNRYAYNNATWPDLITILDGLTPADLATWSQVWVNTAGRPRFATAANQAGHLELQQIDPKGQGRVWPQRFDLLPLGEATQVAVALDSDAAGIPWPEADPATSLFNANALGYGLFPAKQSLLLHWQALDDLQRGSLLVDLYENVLAGQVAPDAYLQAVLPLLREEDNPLLLELALHQVARIYNSFLSEDQQREALIKIESTLWESLQARVSTRRQLYESYMTLASSQSALGRLKSLWTGKLELEGLNFSERDRIQLAEVLAIRLPDESQQIIATQLAQTTNPDELNRLQFISPSLSADEVVRDHFFTSLEREANRQTESWVVDALQHLHHPSRVAHSQKYLQRALELLEEIQVTGDIFFPTDWVQANFTNHRSARAVQTAHDFLAKRPDYNLQLRMKIQQSVDLPERAVSILAKKVTP